MAKEKIDYFAKYRKEREERLVKFGLTDLTEEQMDVISIPNDAPENYHCDGEISPQQAYSRWVGQLKNSGLTPAQVKSAIKFIFG
jgi:hypothetical protein